ncbi:Inner membrane protein YedI [Burkholderiales bacterium]|nr:Inner membrane protein YedI [Burkholderiales bacterium]
MAGIGLIALLDDIATILDDVALMTKVAGRKAAATLDDVSVLTGTATRKTAGVLGDDLALNAEQVSGVRADRELPVVWAVGKGSMVNKAILVPSALAISGFAPWAITPLLMVGGAFLCYEGFEKVAHRFLHGGDEAAGKSKLIEALADPSVDLVALERDRIRGAVRTDFILSAEIIVIALGIVAGAAFPTQVAVLVGIAVLMTFGVYGLVAGIVKLDDAGLWLSRRAGGGAWARFERATGAAILSAAPWLMKGLSVAGTAAMFLVGGGILAHGVPALGHAIEALAAKAAAVPGIGAMLGATAPLLLDAIVGIVAGAAVVGVVGAARRVLASRRASA